MNRTMDKCIKILCLVPFILYCILESLILAVIPKRLRYKDISGETVLITGAGGGVGRELSIRFSKLGCRVILVDINLKGMKETERIIAENPDQVFTYQCDISKREAVYAMAAKIKDEVGRVHILVNNAGVVTGKRFLECSDEMIIKTFEVNALAHFWTCKAFLPDMIEANHGHLVSVASLAGFTGVPLLSDYCASKHAAIGFEESLRIELLKDGITAVKSTVVCPYHISTGLFEGFKGSILPTVTPQHVADEIVTAVLVNQEVVIIPRVAILGVWIKHMLPVSAMKLIGDISDLYTCMDKFRGGLKAE